uniref:PSI domain-containing protein n=1 Tax=Alexandrium andersonii TaxID=327968 RepID=A0A7S2JG23_9DINO
MARAPAVASLALLASCLSLQQALGEGCGDKKECTCNYKSSLFCINYSQCGTSWHPGICQTSDFHLALTLDIAEEKPKGVTFKQIAQKCCYFHKKEPGAALEENLAEAALDPSMNVDAFVRGTVVGGVLSAAAGAAAFLAMRAVRQRYISTREPLLTTE